jgi:hypothetical protein
MHMNETERGLSRGEAHKWKSHGHEQIFAGAGRRSSPPVEGNR